MSEKENNEFNNNDASLKGESLVATEAEPTETVEDDELVVDSNDINKDNENSLPPLEVEASENPEGVRESVEKTLAEAEKEIAIELQEFPENMGKENEEFDKTTRKIKRQNTLLKIICGCLIGCTIVNIFLAMPKVNKTHISVSNGEINKVILNDVTRGEAMSASQIYNKNIDSMVAIHIEAITPSIYGDYVSVGSGSGFIISDDGYVLTNYHVIENATKISVVLADGKEYLATLVGSEADNDVAILKLETEDKFTPVVLGKSESVSIGEEIVAIGNPLGELTFSITKGIVSAVDRDIQIDNYTAIDMFQVDCALNQGNSGGPIFNMYGEVIGMVSAKYASETIEGLGFAIPVDDITDILPDLIEHGKVINKSYLGVAVIDITDEMIQQYSMVPGAYVSVVDEGGCAQKAGLKIGDIITALGDEKVDSVSDLLSAKKEYKAGETTTIQVWRGGEYVEMSITFDEYVEVEESEVPGNITQQIPQNIYPVPQNPNQGFSFEDFLWEYFYNNR